MNHLEQSVVVGSADDGSSVALQCEPTAARVARGDEAGRWVEDAKEKKMASCRAPALLRTFF